MQRGIATTLIIALAAAIIGISAIIYGYFVVNGNSLSSQTAKQTVTLPPEHLIPSRENQVGTTECPDTDYTGCDNSSLWTTWDGNAPQENTEPKTDNTGTIYSK